jgi:hypothetical protein
VSWCSVKEDAQGRIYLLSIQIRAVIAQSANRLGYGLDDRGSRFRFSAGAGIFSLHHRLGPTQPPIQWVQGAFYLGVKRPGHEADHSLPSSAEVKNAWSCTSTPQYVFMAWCLVNHRNNFTFTFRYVPNYTGPGISVSVVTRYGQDDRGSIPSRSSEGTFFSSPRSPERLWCLRDLLPNG